MPDYSWVLYDTALFGVTAGQVQTLFQVAQGADATHTTDFTNSRGAGVIPQNEKFVARHVGLSYESNGVEADVEDWYLQSTLRITVANLIVFEAPFVKLIDNNGFSGFYTQAAAANRALIGRWGQGYDLRPEIVVKGGDAFKVEAIQGIALVTASTRIKVMLDGILTRP